MLLFLAIGGGRGEEQKTGSRRGLPAAGGLCDEDVCRGV